MVLALPVGGGVPYRQEEARLRDEHDGVEIRRVVLEQDLKREYQEFLQEHILYVWEQRRAEAKDRTAEQERRVKAIQQKLDKLDETFLYSEADRRHAYGRQRDKLREELTLAKIDHHAEAVDELDVEGILAFAERILPHASDLWVQASLDYKQRLQLLFFPEGIAYDGNRFNRKAVTAPLFSYLTPDEGADERVVTRIFASWNHTTAWLRAVDSLRCAG